MIRTHSCGELDESMAGEQVVLAGWIHHIREHGGVVFIDLRDRYGRTQIVFHPKQEELFERAKKLSSEDVLRVWGTVIHRPPEMKNPEYHTGGIEVVAEQIELLSEAEPPVFPIEDEITSLEETRMRYRYLDLRRGPMRRNIEARHIAALETRKFLADEGFLEIETPILMKSTPEGARDFVVPSRMNPGRFYALPQSPQTYKQILMVAGFDRYFQIARTFRDEDLRADRQPEFTQIDLEMSFVEPNDVMRLSERLLVRIVGAVRGTSIRLPIPRMSYTDAIARYGSDKPDTRFGMELIDVSSIVERCGFGVFSGVVAEGGVVIAITTETQPDLSRKQISLIEGKAKELGAKGLATLKFDGSTFSGSIAKHIGEIALFQLAEKIKPEKGDSVFFIAGEKEPSYLLAGNIRTFLGEYLKLYDPNELKALWVVNFPLFELDDEGNPTPKHHPFTSPVADDIPLLEKAPLEVRANAYDLVLNGNEIAGGSIRIHNIELQRRMFAILGMDADEAQRRFGFLLDAFRYGVPPHGGIAFGFDRLIMVLTGADSIRDVIPFPKTTSGLGLMEGCPSELDEKQLDELHIKIAEEKEH